MKTKSIVMLGIGFLVALASAFLFAFALVSTSHPVAKSAIVTSKEVLAAVGSIKAVGLIGVRQKLVPAGVSCTTSTYVVVGSTAIKFVTVQMSIRTGDRAWAVNELSLGWFGRSPASC